MALVIKDGKLLTLGEGLATAKDPVDPCDCCQPDDPYGCCCYTDDQGQYVTEQMRKSDCDSMPNSSHHPNTRCDEIDCPPDDTSGACCFLDENGEYTCEVTTQSTCQRRGGKWHDGQECKTDDNPDGIDCSDPDNQPDPDPPTGACCYPDGDIPAHCHDDKTQAECELEGGTWHEGKVCNEDGECPPVDPPVPGICLYREDGLGTCWGYNTLGDLLPTDLFATYEEAQAYLDSGGCPDNDPDAPECAKCYCYPVEAEGAPPETPWGIMQECVPYTDEIDEQGNLTGNYICEKVIFLSNCTEEQCEEQAEANPYSEIEWRNDKPADKCKVVNSEDECTESTGVFCPGLDSCPEDLSEGCPEDPNRSNPLP